MNFQLIALDSEHTHTLTVKSEEDRGKRWVIHIASKRVHYFLLFLRSLIHSLSSFSDTIKKTVKNRIEGELINNSTQKKMYPEQSSDKNEQHEEVHSTKI